MNIDNDEQLRRKIQRVFAGRTHNFRGEPKITIIQPKEVRFKKGKTVIAPYEELVDKLVGLFATQRQALRDEVEKAIGEDVFVPEPKSWLDGAADKPKSYKNNYEVVQWAKRENEILGHIRTAISTIFEGKK